MAVTYTTLTVGRASTAATFTVRGYAGAIVGYVPAGTPSTFTVTDLGNGTAAVVATGFDTITDLGNGTAAITGATVTNLGNGLATAA